MVGWRESEYIKGEFFGILSTQMKYTMLLSPLSRKPTASREGRGAVDKNAVTMAVIWRVKGEAPWMRLR